MLTEGSLPVSFIHTFLAHLSQNPMGELIHPSTFLTSLKPQGQLNSNFIRDSVQHGNESLFKWSLYDQYGGHAHNEKPFKNLPQKQIADNVLCIHVAFEIRGLPSLFK